MSSNTLVISLGTTREPLAPWWHTVLVLLPISLCSVASWYQHGLANLHLPGVSSRLSSFITVLAMEWLGVLLVWLALGARSRDSAATLARPMRALRYLAQAQRNLARNHSTAKNFCGSSATAAPLFRPS
jgi:hypothetical protein